MVTPHSVSLMNLYLLYEQGILLEGSGVLTQPNYYLEAMQFLQSRHRAKQVEQVNATKKS